MLAEPFDIGVSTAGSRKGLFSRGCRNIWHAVRSAGVYRWDHPEIGVTWIGQAVAA